MVPTHYRSAGLASEAWKKTGDWFAPEANRRSASFDEVPLETQKVPRRRVVLLLVVPRNKVPRMQGSYISLSAQVPLRYSHWCTSDYHTQYNKHKGDDLSTRSEHRRNATPESVTPRWDPYGQDEVVNVRTICFVILPLRLLSEFLALFLRSTRLILSALMGRSIVKHQRHGGRNARTPPSTGPDQNQIEGARHGPQWDDVQDDDHCAHKDPRDSTADDDGR